MGKTSLGKIKSGLKKCPICNRGIGIMSRQEPYYIITCDTCGYVVKNKKITKAKYFWDRSDKNTKIRKK